MKEFKLTESDMPNGYAIVNETQEEVNYELADEVDFSWFAVQTQSFWVQETNEMQKRTAAKKNTFFIIIYCFCFLKSRQWILHQL